MKELWKELWTEVPWPLKFACALGLFSSTTAIVLVVVLCIKLLMRI